MGSYVGISGENSMLLHTHTQKKKHAYYSDSSPVTITE